MLNKQTNKNKKHVQYYHNTQKKKTKPDQIKNNLHFCRSPVSQSLDGYVLEFS